MGAEGSQQGRIESLDQFRGYTVLGMFVVNFLGHFHVIPEVLKHHPTYCSYADTIMPQFFFAVGFAYRLTLCRRLQKDGPRLAYLRALRRNLGLILLGVVIYHLDGSAGNWSELRQLGLGGWLLQAFQRQVFQTLVHIGLTALWIMPVIAAGPLPRVGFGCFSGLLHVLLSHAFYYDWVMHRPGIDGGPLGFLTWSVPMLAGTLAYDIVTSEKSVAGVRRLLTWGAVLVLLGYTMACLNLVTPPNQASGIARITGLLVEPPFMAPSRPVNQWTMSQRAGSLSYQTFGAGFCLAIYALFVLVCDIGRTRVGLWGILGRNALAAYLIHEMVGDAITPYAPKDAPLWYVLSAFCAFMAICFLFIRHLDKHKLYLRL